MDAMKKAVGYESIRAVKDGMVVGLGTGSTANYMIEAIAEKVQAGKLSITAVSTSERTRVLAESYGIPVANLEDVDHIDITIDGADELTLGMAGIKGGGGALLYEKIVATNSNRVIWIVDEGKVVENLGAFPLPVEVVPYGAHFLVQSFEEKGYKPVLRVDEEGELFVTDSHHNIIDLHLGKIEDPAALADELKSMTGVVEHGIFLDIANEIYVGTTDEVLHYEKEVE